ncbi:MAG: response regulator, partial [Acidobacteria bacterium]|nr:response regulator [Acidobacteriota bacterium]
MKGGRILVIDDEPQIRRVMRAALTAHGYEVIDARTCEEGLEKVRQNLPDLILLDMNLPAMGGLATCRAIRAGSETPIIIISVRNSERDKVE